MPQNHAAQKISQSPVRHIGKFVWFEVRTADVPSSAKFFSELVGWTIEKMPMGPDTYTMATVNGAPVAGFVDSDSASFSSYVSVDDVDAAAKRVAKAGGKVLGDAFDVPTVGRMVEVTDPDGAPFFLYAGATDDHVHEPAPGTFLWNELWAKNDTRALAFLTSVLGYEVDEMKMGAITYRVLKTKRESVAGLMVSPVPELPAHWLPYIHVVDVDATLARAKGLGATLEGEPQAVAGVGRFASLRSPGGARFAVMTPAATA